MRPTDCPAFANATADLCLERRIALLLDARSRCNTNQQHHYHDNPTELYFRLLQMRGGTNLQTFEIHATRQRERPGS